METPEQQGLELAKEGVKEGVKQFFAPVQSLIERLLGPAVTEIGLGLADSAREWRRRRYECLLKETQDILDAARVEVHPVPPRIVFSILDNGSVEDDEGLQSRWATLLANAARTDFDAEILPAFPDILRQLTCAEVQFLEKVDSEVSADESARREQLKVEKPQLHEPYVSAPLRKNTLASASRVMLGNLRRLELLTPYREQAFDDDGTRNIFEPANYLYLSAFGRAFVRACRPKETSRADAAAHA